MIARTSRHDGGQAVGFVVRRHQHQEAIGRAHRSSVAARAFAPASTARGRMLCAGASGAPTSTAQQPAPDAATHTRSRSHVHDGKQKRGRVAPTADRDDRRNQRVR